MMRKVIAATWNAVFDFPSWPASMTIPSLIAMVRSPVTMNSRAITTMTTQAATRPRWTSITSAAITMSLSASGSRNFPITVTRPVLRATHPSRKSVVPVTAYTIPAMKLFTFDSAHVKYRNTGIMAIRTSVIAFGVLRNSLRSERATALLLRGRGRIGDDATLARELDGGHHRRLVVLDERAHARRERAHPADERRERDLERRGGEHVDGHGLSGGPEQEPAAAAQVHEVQRAGVRRLHA